MASAPDNPLPKELVRQKTSAFETLARTIHRLESRIGITIHYRLLSAPQRTLDPLLSVLSVYNCVCLPPREHSIPSYQSSQYITVFVCPPENTRSPPISPLKHQDSLDVSDADTETDDEQLLEHFADTGTYVAGG